MKKLMIKQTLIATACALSCLSASVIAAETAKTATITVV